MLPFVDMSPQQDQEYFCDGITEELINRLAEAIEGLSGQFPIEFELEGQERDVAWFFFFLRCFALQHYIGNRNTGLETLNEFRQASLEIRERLIVDIWYHDFG